MKKVYTTRKILSNRDGLCDMVQMTILVQGFFLVPPFFVFARKDNKKKVIYC